MSYIWQTRLDDINAPAGVFILTGTVPEYPTTDQQSMARL